MRTQQNMAQNTLDASADFADHFAGFAIGRAWEKRADLTPTALALVYEDRQWQYGELYRASLHVAHTLQHKGLKAGDRIILMMDNGPDFLVTFFGCQMLGILAVPASPKSSVERVQYMVKDCEAALILYEPAMGTRARGLHQAQTYATQMLELTINSDPNPAPLDQFDISVDSCAFIQYTSGSTGHSKGVMISHRAALENVRAFCAEMKLGQNDVFSSLLPLFHDMGLMCFGLAPMLYGHPLILYPQESISLYRWLSGVAEHQATITGAPDSLLQIANRVVENPADYNLQSLRMLICGSEPVRRESVESFGTRFQVSSAIKPAYGMAELTLCATITSITTPMRIDAGGSVASGQPIQGVRVEILADDGSRSTTAHVRGEIVVHSPSAMLGYWQRPEASREAFTDDGGVLTGDLGYLDEDGFLYVIGRKKNMLVRTGQKYSPHDLEMAAHDFPQLRRVAVVQLQNAKTTIVSVLEVDRRLLNDEKTLSDLARQYRQAAFKFGGISPDVCMFVMGGTIPTTENGKFRHAALRTMIESGTLKPGWADSGFEVGNA